MEIANFAITEYNHKSNANLKLVKIESCNRQVHGFLGNSYKLVLLASNGTTEETNKYWVRLGIQPSEKYISQARHFWVSSFSIICSSFRTYERIVILIRIKFLFDP
ncbi:hypothetical protein Ahy_B04g069593 [Arachis hypogaea]|uniref:Cystatin domain-containing protein n=1 Tax=Arachis hypogaea TaxID=3818 RepID=A0A444ZD17_ARAHY|nr:hypothetical protein Ahy_B04g069593 [Arachis hypogaea]